MSSILASYIIEDVVAIIALANTSFCSYIATRFCSYIANFLSGDACPDS